MQRCFVRGCRHSVRSGLRRHGFGADGTRLADGEVCWRCRRRLDRRSPSEERDRGLALIRAFGATLTRPQLAVLSRMARDPDDEDCELVREGRVAYLACDRVASSVVDALLRACAVSDVSLSVSVERYRINETGLGLLVARGIAPP